MMLFGIVKCVRIIFIMFWIIEEGRGRQSELIRSAAESPLCFGWESVHVTWTQFEVRGHHVPVIDNKEELEWSPLSNLFCLKFGNCLSTERPPITQIRAYRKSFSCQWLQWVLFQIRISASTLINLNQLNVWMGVSELIHSCLSMNVNPDLSPRLTLIMRFIV